MKLSFITARKEGCNAIYNGHVYTFDLKKDPGFMYWQCKGKRNLQCKARFLYTQEKPSEHSFPSSVTHIEILMAVSKIKNDSTVRPILFAVLGLKNRGQPRSTDNGGLTVLHISWAYQILASKTADNRVPRITEV